MLLRAGCWEPARTEVTAAAAARRSRVGSGGPREARRRCVCLPSRARPGKSRAAPGSPCAGGSNQPEPAARAEQRRFVRGAAARGSGNKPGAQRPARPASPGGREPAPPGRCPLPPSRPRVRQSVGVSSRGARARSAPLTRHPGLTSAATPRGPRRAITGGGDGGARPRSPFAEGTTGGRSATAGCARADAPAYTAGPRRVTGAGRAGHAQVRPRPTTRGHAPWPGSGGPAVAEV